MSSIDFRCLWDFKKFQKVFHSKKCPSKIFTLKSFRSGSCFTVFVSLGLGSFRFAYYTYTERFLNSHQLFWSTSSTWSTPSTSHFQKIGLDIVQKCNFYVHQLFWSISSTWSTSSIFLINFINIAFFGWCLPGTSTSSTSRAQQKSFNTCSDNIKGWIFSQWRLHTYDNTRVQQIQEDFFGWHYSFNFQSQ